MSNRQRVYRTHAIVLRRRDFRDADRILTIFTPNYGKLEVIAKGVRKTTSRKAGHLELFSHSALMLAQARTWDIVTEVVGVESYPSIRTDLDKISQAAYIGELIDCFSESDDENQPLWELLILTLQELDAHDAPERRALLQHWFETHLLSLVGFQPELFQCLNCGEELQPVANYISFVGGGVVCPDCGRGQRELESIDADVLKVLRFIQSRHWSGVSQVNVRPHILRQVGNVLYRYLLTVLERQLKSVDFMRRLQYMAQSTTPAMPSDDAALGTDTSDNNTGNALVAVEPARAGAPPISSEDTASHAHS